MRLQAIHMFLLCYWFFNFIGGKQVAFKQTLDMTTQTTFFKNQFGMYISLTHSVDEKKGKVSVLLLFESKLL